MLRLFLDSKLTSQLSAWLVVLVKVFRSTTTIALESLLSREPIDIRAEIGAYMLQLQTDSLKCSYSTYCKGLPCVKATFPRHGLLYFMDKSKPTKGVGAGIYWEHKGKSCLSICPIISVRLFNKRIALEHNSNPQRTPFHSFLA